MNYDGHCSSTAISGLIISQLSYSAAKTNNQIKISEQKQILIFFANIVNTYRTLALYCSDLRFCFR